MTLAMTLTLALTPLAPVARADDENTVSPVVLKIFPMWEERECPKDTYACYDFSKTKALINIDLDMQILQRRLDSATQDIGYLKGAIDNLKEALVITEKDLAEEKGRLAEKQAVLEATTFKLKKAGSKSFTSALPWVVTVGAVCLVAAFFGGVYVGNKT